MNDVAALLALFRRSFSNSMRSDEEVWRVLSDLCNHVVNATDAHDVLIGTSVIHQTWC